MVNRSLTSPYFYPGLKEYFGANPALTFGSSFEIVRSNNVDTSSPTSDFDDQEIEEFYDAIAHDGSLDDEDSDDDADGGDGSVVPTVSTLPKITKMY